MAVRIVEQAWSRDISGERIARRFGTHAIGQAKTPLAWEYAKYKNHPFRFQHRDTILNESLDDALEVGMTDDPSRPATISSQERRKQLAPAAQRALAEAEARRKAVAADAKPIAKEFQGPKGPDPTRYGDWENKGIASDF